MSMPTVQQVLAEQDDVKASELLFTLLAESSSGRELSSVVAEVAQGVLKSKWSLQVKRLTYDLCKAVPLSDADSQFIISGIRADINSGDTELCALALNMLANVQPHLLATLLSIGELAQLCSRPLVSDSPAVRAAAVSTLGRVLLVPEVLHAASSSAGMANQVNEHWQSLTDALLDEDEPVVAAAVTATAALLRAGLAADVRLSEGYLVERLAAISAARVAAALGAVLHACQDVPTQARVDTLALLQLIVEHAVRAGQWAPTDVGGAAGLPSGTLLPGLTSLAPSVWGYCAALLRSGDPAVRLEAARGVLRVAVLVSRPAPPSQVAATVLSVPDPSSATTYGSVPQPTGLLLEAVSSLLELEDSVPLVEAAAEDVLGAVVDGLPALSKRERASVLQQLWAGVGRVKNTPARMELWARAWAAVIQDDDALVTGSPEAASSVLTLLLSERYLGGILSNRGTALGPSSSFKQLNAPSPATSPSQPGPRPAAPAAASTNDLLARPAVDTAPPVRASPPAPEGKDSGGKDAKGGGKSRFFAAMRGIGKGDKEDKGSTSFKEKGQTSFKEKGSTSFKEKAQTSGAAVASSVVKAKDAAMAAVAQATETTVAAATDLGQQIGAVFADNDVPQSAPVPPHGAQRHELVASLLAVVQTCHPAAALAWQLSGDVAAVTAHDQAPPASLGAKYGTWQQQRVLSWVAAARATLHATAGCMLWEPLVVPAITPTVNPTTAQRAPADFATTVQDAWLQLLQAAAAAGRALQALTRLPPAPSGLGGPGAPPALSPQASVMSDATGTPRTASHRHAPALPTLPSAPSSTAGGSFVGGQGSQGGMGGFNPVTHAVNTEVREVSNIIKQVFREWGSLSRAVRARALWVLCHSVDMAPHADELWEHGLRALQDVMCKLVPSGNVARISDLLGSAAQGVLYRSGRVGWSRDRAFVFDVVAASALCERPDYDSSSLVVALVAAQAWATRLQDALASCPAESSKRVLSDVVFQAGRLEAVIREFMTGAEAAGSPILREWGKRTTRSLAACAIFVHPATRALEEAEEQERLAAQIAEREKGKAEKNGGAYDPDLINSSSSSSSSEAGDVGNLLPVSLPTNMYLPQGAARAAARPATAGFSAPAPLKEQLSVGGGFGTGQLANPGSPTAQAAGNRDNQEPFKARAIILHGNGPAHMVASSVSSHPWGYPFSPASRAATLFFSKRSRRARVLSGQVRTAVARCGAGDAQQGTTTGAQGLDDVPALPTHSALRLDSPTFWALLPALGGAGGARGGSSGRGGGSTGPAGGGGMDSGGVSRVESVELCGPGDPVMLVGSVVRDARDASHLVLRIVACNRSEQEVRGAMVQVLALGPAQLDRRAASWQVPRLSPRDKVAHTFTLRLLGYGHVRLAVRLQLVHGGTGASLTTPVALPCRPLSVGLVQHMMHAPLGGTPVPRAFFNTWATLPVRAELAAACVWPGRDGAAVALSAMLRSPLACVLLTYVGVTATYQMGLAGESATGEDILIVVHAQLLPPPASNSASARDTGLDTNNNATTTTTATAAAASKGGTAADAAAGTSNGNAAGAAAAQQAAAAQEAAAADAARQPHALLHISVRSSLPDVALAITSHPVEFLQDLAAGAAQPLGAHLAGAAVSGGAGPRPPLHPRLAALAAAHSQSLRALPAAVSALLGGAGAGAAGGAGGLPDVYAQGVKARSKVSHRFMEAAAAAEWQRLVAQPV